MSAVRLALTTLALLLVGMTTASAAPQTVSGNVTIMNSAFSPTTLLVNVGDSVRWTNMDTVPHTSTSNTNAWNSPTLVESASFTFIFTSAGTFAYHCNFHQSMTGTVVVQSIATPTPTPVPTLAPTPTPAPTAQPTAPPTTAPTAQPTVAPTAQPTAVPTAQPTVAPTPQPTVAPTPVATPSPAPTATVAPSAALTTFAVVAVASSAPSATPLTAVAGGDSGPGPLLVAVGAVLVVGLVGLAFALSRR